MGSNTFVFNLEWYAVLQEYPAEVRFEVYEAIMRYASSGTLIELKPLAKMAFSFIKKEMDYNRQRYETTVEKRREAGKRSAESRSLRPTSVNTCQQNQQVLAKPTSVNTCQQNQHMLAKPTSVNTCQQNQHMSTQGNYNDNVNDNVNVLPSATTRTREEDAGVDDQDFIDDFFRERITVEAFCASNRITVEEFRKIALEIVTEWKLIGHKHDSVSEARRHLINQARIKIKHLENGKSKTDGRHSRRRGVDSEALSAEDYTGEI